MCSVSSNITRMNLQADHALRFKPYAAPSVKLSQQSHLTAEIALAAARSAFAFGDGDSVPVECQPSTDHSPVRDRLRHAPTVGASACAWYNNIGQVNRL